MKFHLALSNDPKWRGIFAWIGRVRSGLPLGVLD
jgi:hypothetical protein